MNREAERKRLVELVKNQRQDCNNANCGFCGYASFGGYPECQNNKLADILLDNGIVVPPVKVGDKVYYPSASFGRIFEKTVDEILMSDKGNYIHFASTYMPFENIGKTVFLTREEAEKALEGKGE